MATTIKPPPIPPGFKLEETPRIDEQALPPIPPGFRLEAAQPEIQPVAPGDFLREDVLRPALRAGRAIAAGTVGAAGDIAQMITALPAEGLASALETAGYQGAAQAIRGAQAVPASEVIRESIDVATGGLAAPRTPTEEMIDVGGEFIAGMGLGAIPKIAGRAGTFAAQQLTPRAATELAGAGAAGVATEAVRQERPEDVVSQIGAGLAAGIAPGMAARGLQRGITRTVVPSPEKINIEAIQAGKEIGQTLPASAVTDSRIVRFLESRAAQSGLSGQSYTNLIKRVDEDAIRNFDNILEEVSPTKFSSTEIGELTQNAIAGRQRASNRVVRARFGQVIDEFGGEIASTTKTKEYLSDVIPKLEKTLAPSASKEQVLSKLRDVKQQVDAGTTDIETLINTKVDLNDVATFDALGGVKKFINGLVGAVNQDIKAYSAKNAEFGSIYNSANELAKTTAKSLRNDLIKSISNAKSPEIILEKIRRPSDVMLLEKAAGKSPKMRRVVQGLKRARLEQLLTNKVIREQGVEFGRAAALLEERNHNLDLIKSLAGPRNVSRLEAAKATANAIKEGQQFFNFSKSGNVVQDNALLLTGITSIITGNPIGATIVGTPYATARLLTSRRYMNALEKAARSTKRKDMKAARAAVNILVQEIDKIQQAQPQSAE